MESLLIANCRDTGPLKCVQIENKPLPLLFFFFFFLPLLLTDKKITPDENVCLLFILKIQRPDSLRKQHLKSGK